MAAKQKLGGHLLPPPPTHSGQRPTFSLTADPQLENRCDPCNRMAARRSPARTAGLPSCSQQRNMRKKGRGGGGRERTNPSRQAFGGRTKDNLFWTGFYCFCWFSNPASHTPSIDYPHTSLPSTPTLKTCHSSKNSSTSQIQICSQC